MTIQDQCPWSIRYGTSATTRCRKTDHITGRRAYRQAGDPDSGEVQIADPDPEHEGPGLMPGQIIHWFSGDRREYTGDWPGYCDKIPLPPFEGGCTLPLRHHGGCVP